jgi:hypothetical protein
MKYFKIADRVDGKEFYISSVLPNESAAHIALSLHLDETRSYNIKEISYNEFAENTRKVFEN